jgi:hypothetical protein
MGCAETFGCVCIRLGASGEGWVRRILLLACPCESRVCSQAIEGQSSASSKIRPNALSFLSFEFCYITKLSLFKWFLSNFLLGRTQGFLTDERWYEKPDRGKRSLIQISCISLPSINQQNYYENDNSYHANHNYWI